MSNGWHRESKRHSLARKGVKTAKKNDIDPRIPKTPLTRYDIEDSVEYVRSNRDGRMPLWSQLMAIFSDDQNQFEVIINDYGWELYSDDELFGFSSRKNPHKTITISNDNSVTIFDHDFFGKDARIEDAKNFYQIHKFDTVIEANAFAFQQLASDIKEKDKLNYRR